jgi:prepilin-type processing-associated H-X9-DG protein
MKLYSERNHVNWISGPQRRNIQAFSRLDLMVTVGVILFFGILFGYEYTGEHARIARCASNLEMLGQAMHSYANDHNDELPAAVIDLGETHVSYDTKLFPYLKPSLGTATDGHAEKQHAMALAHWFFCPSDPVQHNGIPRSYAMAEHDMTLNDWPPGPDSYSGPGLFWDSFWTTNVLSADKAAKAALNPDLLPKIKLSDLPAPADTLLLTEYINRINDLQGMGYARVGSVNDQEAAFHGDSSSFHYGKFNYLMVDGHVEFLSGEETGSPGGRSGIWSIKPGD